MLSKKQSVVKGTLILTAAGLITRVMGFFYRIFLSRTFGEEGVGLYQLIFPVYALCYSLTTAGIETAISRTVARSTALGKEEDALGILYCGLFFSVTFSILCSILLRQNAACIAETFLHDSRCRILLSALSACLPFCAVHSCISGYCYGLKMAQIPAISQLIEQTVRIGTVFMLYVLLTKNTRTISIRAAVFGLTTGEMASALYSAVVLSRTASTTFRKIRHPIHFKSNLTELLSLSVPLTANRLLINLLQSVEAVNIPSRLEMYNMTTNEALSMYGVLNGMALPCIMFPSAITSSISLMLLPAVADIQACGNRKKLIDIIKKTAGSCFILGFACCLSFLTVGNWMGITIFHSVMAGKFMVTLAWICPFLYTNGTFLSVINGLGKTRTTFFINSLGLLIRIFSVFFAIPQYGIYGYLWGLLFSQFVVCGFSLISIYKIIDKTN